MQFCKIQGEKRRNGEREEKKEIKEGKKEKG